MVSSMERRDLEEEIIIRKYMKKLLRAGMETEKKRCPKEIIELNNENIDHILSVCEIAVVDFWAPWCAPCRFYAPIFEHVASRFAGRVLFAKVNVDENPDLASRFLVMSIPTTIIFVKGKAFRRLVGAIPEQLLEKEIVNVLRQVS